MKLNTIYNKFKAFTLAEVLLVVAIIGITAAIALPNLSQSVDEDKYVMLAKTTYNELDSGFTRMLTNKSIKEIIADAGATTNAAASEAVVNELSKYIKMGTNCGTRIQQCHNSSKKYVEYDGSSIEDKTFGESFTNTGAAFTLPSGAVVVVMADVRADYDFTRIYFDVDGAKGPSKKGVDIFGAFTNSNTDGLELPSIYGGELDTTYDTLTWILANDNMDYLHCNDLNWSTKHQCD